MDKHSMAKMLAAALTGRDEDGDETDPNKAGFEQAMSAGIGRDGADELRRIIAGGITNGDTFNMFDGADVKHMAGIMKPLSNLVLEGDLAAEQQRGARTLRQLVMAHHMSAKLKEVLDERNTEIERLKSALEDSYEANQLVSQERDRLKSDLDVAVTSVYHNMTYADFESDRADELRAVVAGLAENFDGKGKGAELAKAIAAAVADFDNAEHPKPEGVDDSHVVDHDVDTHGMVDV